MLGGIIMNLIVGFVIYSMVLLVWGETVLPNKYSVNVDPRLETYGFQSGDHIISFNDVNLETFQDLRRTAFFETVTEATVVRNGNEVDLSFDTELGQILVNQGIRRPFSLQVPSLVDSVIPDSRASNAGLLPGDIITGVDEVQTGKQLLTINALESRPNSPILLHIDREGQILTLPAMTDTAGHIGFVFATPASFTDSFVQEEIKYSFGEAVVSGFFLAGSTLQDYALSMRFLASKAGASQVGSLITFGSIFDGKWDWLIFWRNTAFLSLILAFMNLLPIPALDGGHVVFLLYEMVVGKPAPQKIMEGAQVVGIVLLLGLMVFALGNDFWRLFTGGFN